MEAPIDEGSEVEVKSISAEIQEKEKQSEGDTLTSSSSAEDISAKTEANEEKLPNRLIPQQKLRFRQKKFRPERTLRQMPFRRRARLSSLQLVPLMPGNPVEIQENNNSQEIESLAQRRWRAFRRNRRAWYAFVIFSACCW